MTGTRAKAAALLATVFVAGALAGSAITVRVSMRGLSAILAGDPKHTLAKLYGEVLGRQLHLSAQQRTQVEQIVDEDHAELARMGQALYPETSEMRRRRHARIRALLAPTQQAQFDVLALDYERRRREEIDLPPSASPP